MAQPLLPYDQSVINYLSQFIGHRIDHAMVYHLVAVRSFAIRAKQRDSGYLVSMLEQIKLLYIKIGLIVLAIVIVFPFLTFRPSSLGSIVANSIFVIVCLPGYLLLAASLYRTYQRVTGEQWLGTDKLKQIWPEIESYREYIKMAELNELRFESLDPQLVKNKNLPYAIALGLNTDWQRSL